MTPDTLLLEIPAGVKLAAVCEFAASQGCRVERLRSGAYRITPRSEPPGRPKAPVIPIRRTRE
jgi:hypothetical protein